MADAAEKKEEKKVKKPSALKRDLQSKRKRLKNRSYRAEVLTAVRTLSASLSDKSVAQEKLNAIYSLMDAGVKKGIFKANKAARTKSRLSARLNPR